MNTAEYVELDFWERFNKAFSKSDEAYAGLVESLRQQSKTYFQKFQKCLIRGTGIEFEKFVAPEDIEKVCQDIWDHPDKYSDYQAESDSAYYDFLKYLWVKFPDGTEKRLSDVVKI
mgnify:CR=1 FL=1